MAECLYYGDKPIGLIQSNAEDVEYSTGVSVKDKIDSMTPVINQLLNIKNIPTTETEYNVNWQNYDLIVAELRFYDNVRATITLSKSYMAITSSGSRPSIMYTVDASTTVAYDFYTKGTSGKMYVKANNASSSSNMYGIAITGYKF